MLTRLRVKGFKNLIDTEIHFGPLTCIAGPNGVGKSNVFDVIRFIALLADHPFIEAASLVRGGDDREALFTRGGDQRLSLECDVLIPKQGADDFGQPAEASHTYLSYELDFRLNRQQRSGMSVADISLEREALVQIPVTDALPRLGFGPQRRWLNSALTGRKRRQVFISTDTRAGNTGAAIHLHSDRTRAEDKAKRGGGKPTAYPVSRLPRTVLSSAQNAQEHSTAVLLRQELRSWRQLQLEPSALRAPDGLQGPDSIASNGAHVPATLFRLAAAAADPASTYAEVANRLARLIDGVDSVRIDHDKERKLLRFMLKDTRGVELPASSLSDGTMRFVALAVMEMDAQATGLICLEEPENGIHPQRMEAMVQLLGDMVSDTSLPCGGDNPLRQVIFSTHSPVAVSQTIDSDVLFARVKPIACGGHILPGIELVGLAGTWRASHSAQSISRGEVYSFLGAHSFADGNRSGASRSGRRTVAAAVGLTPLLPGITDGPG